MSYNILSKFYDRLMTDVNYDAWCDFIIEKTNLNKNSIIVDAACGTGAIALRLAKHGARVIGVDNSDEMLAVASQNARNSGVNVSFSSMDISNMNFHKPVDAICCVCDGVNYISEKSVHSFIKSAYNALTEKGTLIFDISSEYKLRTILGDNLFFEDYDDVTYMWQNTVKNKTVDMDLCFFVKQLNGSYIRYDEQHTQYIHKYDDIYKELSLCGFSKINAYDCYSTNSLSSNTERITFVATK